MSAETGQTTGPNRQGTAALATILFADIVGSTDQFWEGDAETAGDLLYAAVAQIRQCVHRYGGVIARVQGDGVMAVFGAPEHVEDHALRACYAGHDIARTFQRPGEELQVRVGIDTGRVVTRLLRNDFGADFDAVGRPVNVASKAEAAIEPNAVAITSAVRDLVVPFAETEPRQSIQIGPGREVELHRLTSIATELLLEDVYRGAHPLEGRDSVVAELEPLCRKPDDGMPGAVIGLVGEAGIGKSRIAYEAVRRARGDGLFVAEVTGKAIWQATPYAALNAMVSHLRARAEAGLLQMQGSNRLGAAERGLLERWFAATREARMEAPLDGIRSQECPILIAALLRAAAAEGDKGVMLIVEDYHYLDPETRECIDTLFSVARDQFAMNALVTARPRMRDALQRVCQGMIELRELEEAAARRLAAHYLGTGEASGPMVEEIISRSGGVPFFLQELARLMVTQPARVEGGAAALPLAIENLIAARVDDLSAPARSFLRAASLLGSPFDVEIVEAMTGPLGQNQSSIVNELIAQSMIEPVAGGQFAFRHQLFCDGVAGGVLGRRRKALHARAAESMQSLHGETPARAEQIAYHYEKSERFAEAMEFRLKACKYAVKRSAAKSVSENFDRAFALRPYLKGSARHTLSDLILASLDGLIQLGRIDVSIEALDFVIADPDGAGGSRREALARGNLAFLNWFLGRYQVAVTESRKALAIARDSDDLPVRALAQFALGVALHGSGALHAAVAQHEELIALLEAQAVPKRLGATLVPLARSRAFAAWVLCELGRFDAAMAHTEKAERELAGVKQPYSWLLVHAARGYALLHLERFEEAAEDLVRAREICFKEALFAMEPCATGWLAMALTALGRSQEAQKVCQVSVDAKLYRHGSPQSQFMLFNGLIEAYLTGGDLGEARSALERAEAIARRANEPASTLQATYQHARLLHLEAGMIGRESEAARLARDVAAHAQGLGLRPLQRRAHLLLAEIADAAGNASGAAEHGNLAEMLARPSA